jgi:iron complex transport system ATP-binding protein
MLGSKDLRVAVGDRLLVDSLDLALEAGQFVGMLGENGAGKTTTLHVLAGLRDARAGQVTLEDRPLDTWSRRAVARRLGLLMQNYEDPFPSTVLETVLMGRHPHVDFWRWETARDVQLAHAALERVDLADLGHRSVASLSGGERRRLALAMVLAQDPQIFLLDEPVTHLDPAHQRDVMRLMRERADAGRCVLAVLHDINDAARYCDRCLLLFGRGDWLYGSAADVLTERNLTRLYGMDIRALEIEGRRIFVSA